MASVTATVSRAEIEQRIIAYLADLSGHGESCIAEELHWRTSKSEPDATTVQCGYWYAPMHYDGYVWGQIIVQVDDYEPCWAQITYSESGGRRETKGNRQTHFTQN